MRKYYFILLIVIMLFSSSALSDVPASFSYQGVLSNTTGVYQTGDFTMRARLYDADTGGTILHVDTNTVSVLNGYFSTVIGDANTLDVNFLQPFWMSLEINSDGEMSPRIRLDSAPAALAADRAFDFNLTNQLLLGGATANGLVTPGDINTAGNLTIGGRLLVGTAQNDNLGPGDMNISGRIYGSGNTVQISGNGIVNDLNVAGDTETSNLQATGFLTVGNSLSTLDDGLSAGDINTSGNVILNNSDLNFNIDNGTSADDVYYHGAILSTNGGGSFPALRLDSANTGFGGSLAISGILLLNTTETQHANIRGGDINLNNTSATERRPPALFGGQDGMVSIGTAFDNEDLNITGRTVTGSATLTGLVSGDINIDGNIYVGSQSAALSSIISPLKAVPAPMLLIGTPDNVADANVTGTLFVTGIMTLVSNPGSVIYLGSSPLDSGYEGVTQDVNVSKDLNVNSNLYLGNGAILVPMLAARRVIRIGHIADNLHGGNNFDDITDLNVTGDLNASNIIIPGTLTLGNAIPTHINSTASEGDINASGDIFLAADLNLLDTQADNRPIWIDGNVLIRAQDGTTWMTCNASTPDVNAAFVCSPA